MRWSPGLSSLLCSPLFVPVYLCANVGLRGATHRSACPFLRHSESGPLGLSVRECGATGSASGQTTCPVRPTLRQSGSCHSHASPLRPVPVSAPPTGLDECFFFIYLVLDFPAVRFSVSSGCARRRSVSTYTAILVPLNYFIAVQLQLSAFPPKPAKPTSLPCFHPHPLVFPCVFYSSSSKLFSPLFPRPSPLAIVRLILISKSLVIFCLLFSFIDYVLVKGEIIWYLSLTAWVISLSIMLSSSIHTVAKGINSFFFSAV